MLNPIRKAGWVAVAVQSLGYLGAWQVVMGVSAFEGIDPRIERELGPLLSPGARIALPGSPDFDRLQSRWRAIDRPIYGVVVAVATEEDVAHAVKYANANQIPFLATTGTHGVWQGLRDMQGGMAIWMRNLSKIEVAPDGKSAALGGGVRGAEVQNKLWEFGKQTTTGMCTCVSVAGPALGGGHGLLQGKYGLLADQIISARVVLANGDMVTVSEDSHSDLFWGLKGAGHNFGIVTEFQYRVYDVEEPEWSYETLMYTGDQFEALYGTLNGMAGHGSSDPVHWGTWMLNSAVDPVNVSLPPTPCAISALAETVHMADAFLRGRE